MRVYRTRRRWRAATVRVRDTRGGVPEATAAARSATDEAEATKVEIEVLRNLIDEGSSRRRGASVGPRWRTLAPRRRSPPRP